MAKKVKLDFITLSDKFGYYRFWRHEVNGVKGYCYQLDKKITDKKELEWIYSWKNVSLLKGAHGYTAVFLGDKCLPKAACNE